MDDPTSVDPVTDEIIRPLMSTILDKVVQKFPDSWESPLDSSSSSLGSRKPQDSNRTRTSFCPINYLDLVFDDDEGQSTSGSKRKSSTSKKLSTLDRKSTSNVDLIELSDGDDDDESTPTSEFTSTSTSINKRFKSILGQIASSSSSSSSSLANLNNEVGDNNDDKTNLSKSTGIQQILSKRTLDSKAEYLVCWQSGSESWEVESFLQKKYPSMLESFQESKQLTKRKRGRPIGKKSTPSKTPATATKPSRKSARIPVVTKKSLEQTSRTKDSLFRPMLPKDSPIYNSNYKIVDYLKLDSQISYKVHHPNNDSKCNWITSKSARKQCPINVIRFLESKVYFRNSMSFDSIVKYGEYLKKYC